jgi:hypothetical protein
MGKKSDTSKPAAIEAPASTTKTAKPAPAAAVPKPPSPAPVIAETAPAKAAPRKKPAKKSAKKPPSKAVSFSTEEVALRAYFISEHRQKHGLPGDAHSDWVKAERQLKSELRKKDAKKKPAAKKKSPKPAAA